MPPVWVNGSLVASETACVPVSDHGLLTGDGVFETVKVYGGRPFAVRRHLERLARSAAILELAMPEPALLRQAITEVLHAGRLSDARLRITMTAGPAPLGSERGTEDPTVIVAAAPSSPWPPATDLAVAPWPKNQRSALVGAKTTSYAENVVALAWARRQGAGEAIFANLDGRLCEGTGSNVFVSHEGRLVTPPVSSGCLAGVTRALLLELGVAEEVDVPVDALIRADEAFITSSTREVQPVRAVDGQVLPRGPGPLTGAAAAAFAALVAREIDP